MSRKIADLNPATFLELAVLFIVSTCTNFYNVCIKGYLFSVFTWWRRTAKLDISYSFEEWWLEYGLSSFSLERAQFTRETNNKKM